MSNMNGWLTRFYLNEIEFYRGMLNNSTMSKEYKRMIKLLKTNINCYLIIRDFLLKEVNKNDY